MPKLDLVNAVQIKSAAGEWLQAKGQGFTWAKPAPVAPLSRLAVHVDSDIDTVGERDDIAAMALWLGNQDDFNLLGFTCSPPDGNHQEYINCINAYDLDRPTIVAKPGINAADFKTGTELLALVQDGANADAPARGYRLVGESQYTNAHAAAQLLIANARDHGDAISSDPTRKLWVAVQGGYVTLAQALYEAMDPAGPMELPDILDRIRVVGQPNWNSSKAPNAWNYIFSNAWPAAGTPGMFGDLWMICGYLQWHAFNRDNGTTDTTFWNDITANSEFGQHLRDTLTRPSGAFLTPHFRAGDAGIWFWMKSAKDLGSFDPENPNNLCGVYRTYEGVNPWPSQTVGYGAGSGINTSNPNPEGVTWSPTIWAPELTVSSYEAAEAAVDLGAWYTMVAGYMERFQGARAPAQVAEPTVTGTGTSRTVSWTAPDDQGSPITDYIITLDGNVVADGVGTATGYELTTLPDGSYSVTVAAVNAVGTGPASPAASFNVGSPPATGFAFDLNEGTGTVLTGQSGATATSSGLNWEANPTRLDFDGSNARIEVPISDAASGAQNFVLGAVVQFDDVSTDRQVMSRNGTNGTTQRQFQFRVKGGALEFVAHQNPSAATTLSSASGLVTTGTWYLLTLLAEGDQYTLRINGANVATGTLPNLNRTTAMLGVPVLVGERWNPSLNQYVDTLNGDLLGFAAEFNSNDLAGMEASLRAIATEKGITLL
jgi:hypothetical protein